MVTDIIKDELDKPWNFYYLYNNKKKIFIIEYFKNIHKIIFKNVINELLELVLYPNNIHKFKNLQLIDGIYD